MGNPSKDIKLVEVGPRDGLQNEPSHPDVDTRIALINKLAGTGLNEIEAGAFVSPKWVPQMADSGDVYRRIEKPACVSFPMLVPNEKGLDLALEAGVQKIALFTATSDDFTAKNINCSVEESLARFETLAKRAIENKMSVRGYISTVISCPYAGPQAPEKALSIASKLVDMGCEEVSLGDTIGVGTPANIESLLEVLFTQIDADKLALHLHDTYGQAIANILKGLEMGIRTFDTSIAGLGGCPYAKGASGNVATEDVVYMLHGLGFETGVDLKKLIQVSHWICETLGREQGSKVSRAMQA